MQQMPPSIAQAAAQTGVVVNTPNLVFDLDRDKWRQTFPTLSGHMLTYGPPGTGKSFDWSLYAQWSTEDKPGRRHRGKRYYETNLTRQRTSATDVGHWLITGAQGQMTFNHGPVARAMLEGTILIVNDVHLAGDDWMDTLFFVLDTRPGARFDMPNGTALTAEDGFQCLLTMNGDPAEILDEPIRDRLLTSFEVRVPSREALLALDDDVRDLCKSVYAQAKSGESPKLTYRTLQNFCKIRQQTGDVMLAAHLATGTKESARALVETVLVFQGSQAQRQVI